MAKKVLSTYRLSKYVTLHCSDAVISSTECRKDKGKDKASFEPLASFEVTVSQISFLSFSDHSTQLVDRSSLLRR